MAGTMAYYQNVFAWVRMTDTGKQDRKKSLVFARRSQVCHHERLPTALHSPEVHCLWRVSGGRDT